MGSGAGDGGPFSQNWVIRKFVSQAVHSRDIVGVRVFPRLLVNRDTLGVLCVHRKKNVSETEKVWEEVRKGRSALLGKAPVRLGHRASSVCQAGY